MGSNMSETNQAIRNALDDLEVTADWVEQEDLTHDADIIRESVQTIREELNDE